MTLTGRLSAFFLGALAIVLVSTSVAVYGLAHVYLYRQLDERLETALDTLEAAVDVEPDGLEWEPADRRMTLGTDPGTDQVRWSIGDPIGRLVDRSANATSSEFPPRGAPDVAPPDSRGDATTTADVPGWRLAGRRLRLVELVRAGRRDPEDDDPDEDVSYPELTVTVGLSPVPVHAALGRLGLALFVISAATWLACALLGRRLVRHALRPLASMADAASRIDPTDPGWSLPLPATRDELEALARAYNDLLARLREAFDAQGRFAGEASHQLRTPLAGLLGQVNVALRRDRPAEEYQRVLSLVRDEAERLRRIVESLLYLARPQAEAGALELEPIELGPWLSEQLARWGGHPRSGDIRTMTPTGARLQVRAHPELLSQAFGNLLENAMKYSEPGTPIFLSAQSEAGAVSLSVEDLGPGLSPEELAHVFEPFYRSESARRRGRAGVGLGLAVAHRIATSFGGSLEAHSMPGRGSRFTLRLPATEDASSAPEVVTRVDSGKDASPVEVGPRAASPVGNGPYFSQDVQDCDHRWS